MLTLEVLKPSKNNQLRQLSSAISLWVKMSSPLCVYHRMLVNILKICLRKLRETSQLKLRGMKYRL